VDHRLVPVLVLTALEFRPAPGPGRQLKDAAPSGKLPAEAELARYREVAAEPLKFVKGMEEQLTAAIGSSTR
jgi:hypothetical protein